jgi:hypothetical protein
VINYHQQNLFLPEKTKNLKELLWSRPEASGSFKVKGVLKNQVSPPLHFTDEI